jgi:hypothetical protein
MPQKHDNYTRKVFDGIGEGWGLGGGGDVKVITRTASAVKKRVAYEKLNILEAV